MALGTLFLPLAGASVTTSLSLAVTEAPDVAAVTILDADQLVLAATEAADMAAVTILDSDPFTLAATEAPDTAAIDILGADLLALAATEAPDVAAISILDADQLALAATEAKDTAEFTVTQRAAESFNTGGTGGRRPRHSSNVHSPEQLAEAERRRARVFRRLEPKAKPPVVFPPQPDPAILAGQQAAEAAALALAAAQAAHAAEMARHAVLLADDDELITLSMAA